MFIEARAFGLTTTGLVTDVGRLTIAVDPVKTWVISRDCRQ
jgi:hypothetical protein